MDDREFIRTKMSLDDLFTDIEVSHLLNGEDLTGESLHQARIEKIKSLPNMSDETKMELIKKIEVHNKAFNKKRR